MKEKIVLKPTNTDYLFKFSIVTAVYNVEAYLSEAIDSILSQDIGFIESVELILVDDGSTDASGAICDEYQHKYPENIVVIHKPNGGVASARNAGIAVARGRYVNFMDSDDKLTPDTLSSVYDFFIEHDKEEVIDLTTHYSYVQMSSASAFFKREALNDHTFDTSLRYAEDSKAIMELLLENPQYGIVPQGRYLYRARTSMNSALNGSKSHREWYIDCLKNYIFWALDEAKSRFGAIPDYVQYNVMYDLQGRFKVDEIPETVLTPHEKTIFLKMLFDAVFQIDDHIILEQKNLSMELKDYIMSIKKAPDSGTLQFDDKSEDAWFQYPDLSTGHASSYQLRLTSMELMKHDILLEGAAKIYLRFPYPANLFLRITTGHTTHMVKCCFREDPEHVFRFNGQKLAVFLKFTTVIPYEMFSGITHIEFCWDCDGHTICYHSLHRMSEFPLAYGQQKLLLNKKSYYATLSSQMLTFEEATPVSKLKKDSEDLLFKITFKIFFLFSCFLCIAIFLPIW